MPSLFAGARLRAALVTAALTAGALVSVAGATTTEAVIGPAVETASGLVHVSVALCNDLLTYDQGLIRRKIGQLSDVTMQKIHDCLKTALGLV